jgi:hypothetical protein
MLSLAGQGRVTGGVTGTDAAVGIRKGRNLHRPYGQGAA